MHQVGTRASTVQGTEAEPQASPRRLRLGTQAAAVLAGRLTKTQPNRF